MITGQWLRCLIFILLLGDFGTFCGVDVYVYIDVVYRYLSHVSFLKSHNQKGTLFSVITNVLCPSCFCKNWTLSVSWMYLNLWYGLCNLSRCLISKIRTSIGQTFIKIKHKGNWIIKILKTRSLPPPPPPPPPPATLLLHAFFPQRN